MKLLKKHSRTAFLIFALQGMITFAAFAQSKSEAAVNAKCETCQDLLSAENIDAFAAGNCRIYQSICNLINQENAIVLKQRSENQYFASSQTVKLSNVTIVLYLDDFQEKGYNVTPQMTLLNENMEVIETVETGYFQLYTFDENQNIVAAEGVKVITKVDENTNQLMMTTMTLPETTKEAAFIQVALQFVNRETSETVVLKQMIQAVTVAE